MGGKYLICSLIAVIVLAVSVRAEQGRFQKVSPENSGFTIQPLVPQGDSEFGRGPALDPTVPLSGPGGVAAVPEPSTIAMLFLGSGFAGAFIALRRRRRA
jgi:hypothetical protein